MSGEAAGPQVMKRIEIDALPAQPWKNGGGVTREIARSDDAQGLIWRLSVADVDSAGPFSIFPGAARVLTVIEGRGLLLRHAGGVVAAEPGAPVSFDGDIPVDCRLVDGPVRDFNLIHDPRRVRASVTRIEPGRHTIDAEDGRPFGLLPLTQSLTVDEFGAAPKGAFLKFTGTERTIAVEVGDGGALLIRIG